MERKRSDVGVESKLASLLTHVKSYLNLIVKEAEDSCGSETWDLVPVAEKSGRGSEGFCGKLYTSKVAGAAPYFLPHQNIKSNFPAIKDEWAYICLPR